MTYLCSETSFPHGGHIYTGVLCLCMTKGGSHSSRVNVSLEHKQDMIPPAKRTAQNSTVYDSEVGCCDETDG